MRTPPILKSASSTFSAELYCPRSLLHPLVHLSGFCGQTLEIPSSLFSPATSHNFSSILLYLITVIPFFNLLYPLIRLFYFSSKFIHLHVSSLKPSLDVLLVRPSVRQDEFNVSVNTWKRKKEKVFLDVDSSRTPSILVCRHPPASPLCFTLNISPPQWAQVLSITSKTHTHMHIQHMHVHKLWSSGLHRTQTAGREMADQR